MNRQSAGLTVFFEGQFWVGIFERVSGNRLSVCRHIFGAEPKDSEVWEFILRDYERLKFSTEVESPVRKAADNPKRRQRIAGKQLQASGVGTKSQQALQMQREEMKYQREQHGRELREAEKQRKFELRQQKRKAKHKGR